MQNKNTAYQKNPNTDNNISKTGYRALFLLMKLLESPRTRDEILQCFTKDSIIKSNMSKDSVTNTINTLRKAGCIISRPTQRTNNKYVLSFHPFMINLSKENVEALHALREDLITLGDWELLMNLNNLYAKFAQLTSDNESKNLLLYAHPLRKVNTKILNELLLFAKIKRHLNIRYDSPAQGEEDLDFAPEFVTFENRKLYVWGYSKKYDNFAYLRVDRILKVNMMNFLGEDTKIQEFEKQLVEVVYKLKGLAAIMYTEHEDEKVIAETPNEEYVITVKAGVSNKFNFIQRILSYGTDCKIFSPDSMKQELLETLKKIKSGYSDDTGN